MEIKEIDMVQLLSNPLFWGILFMVIVAITTAIVVIDFIKYYNKEPVNHFRNLVNKKQMQHQHHQH
mgnify:CR=1 FL=1